MIHLKDFINFIMEYNFDNINYFIILNLIDQKMILLFNLLLFVIIIIFF